MTQTVSQNVVEFPIQANLSYGMNGLQVIPQQAWINPISFGGAAAAGGTVTIIAADATHAFRTLRMFFTADAGGPWLITWTGLAGWRIRNVAPLTFPLDFTPYGMTMPLNSAITVKNEHATVTSNLEILIFGFNDESQS